MSFAKPISKPARGRPGSSTAAHPVQPRKVSKPATRPSSVSSTSSARSTQSRGSIEGSIASVAGASGSISRPASVSSHRGADSGLVEPEPSNSAHKDNAGAGGSAFTPTPNQSTSTPTPTSDPLQVAAQAYPWLYMSSTLEACFQSAETAAEKDLTTRAKELAEEESDISDQRVRLEAERAVEFYDELSTDKFATEAPSIMQAFLLHGDASTTLEAEALQLATSPQGPAEADYYSPMRPYNAILDKLGELTWLKENLQREECELSAAIIQLTQADDGIPDESATESSARFQLNHVFAACLPVLRARAANLKMAHELLEGAKENLAMSLHLESLEFSDEESNREDIGVDS
ncbi:hypothetical protein C8J57DRAFT_1189777 [Mycena rebaudengoi]|nr:hypothetical protein C8J57DRAFT_1189777 [Mycena rebaudengoi]